MNDIHIFFNEMSLNVALKLYATEENISNVHKIYLYNKLLHDSLLVELKADVLNSVKLLKKTIDDDDDFNALNHFNQIFTIVSHKKKTIYENKHNVHIFSNATVFKAKQFIKKYPAIYSRPFDHEFFNVIELQSTYNETLNILNLFASIYFYINNSKHKEELLKRLHEELDDSIGMCLTGHVCRLFNVLKGFSNNFDVIISDYEYYRTKVFNRLSAIINVYDTDNILNEIKRAINTDKIDIQPEHILSVLNEYTGQEWYLHNKLYTFI